MPKSLYWFACMCMASVFGLEVAHGDGWRSFGMGLVLIAFLAVRHDLTEQA